MNNTSSANYYQKKVRSQKKFYDSYQNLSEEEKRKKICQYGCEQYKDLPEDEKQRLIQCRKIIIKCGRTPRKNGWFGFKSVGLIFYLVSSRDFFLCRFKKFKFYFK